MMRSAWFRNLPVLLLAGFVLTGCGGETVSTEELTRISEKFKIRDSEKPAFKACIDVSTSNSPYVKLGEKIMQLDSIPAEVCGCTTKVIAQSFNKEKVAAYDDFLTWLKNPQRKGSPRFAKEDLAKETNAKKVRDKLVESLDRCTRQFANENLEIAKELLTPYVDEAKLKKEAAEKKKKEAEAKAKAEAAKKSAG
jgi:hypothetical protein